MRKISEANIIKLMAHPLETLRWMQDKNVEQMERLSGYGDVQGVQECQARELELTVAVERKVFGTTPA